MTDKSKGWYIIEKCTGPYTDAELLQMTKNSQISLSTMLIHQSKTAGEIVKAERIRGIRAVIEEVAAPDDASPLAKFKGDTLGVTTLDEFKKRHHRKISEHKTAPQLSTNMHRDALASIFAKPWHAEANIVTARIAFPFEQEADPFTGERFMAIDGNHITVAGIPLIELVHEFIDGRLYMITALLPQSGYDAVRLAFSKRYSDDTNRDDARNHDVETWETDDCVLILQRIADEETSCFLLYHRELFALAESRNPGPRVDDF